MVLRSFTFCNVAFSHTSDRSQGRSAELMIRCIEECIRWKISTACTGALKSDVNMYILVMQK